MGHIIWSVPFEQVLLSCPTCNGRRLTINEDRVRCEKGHVFTRPKCPACGKSDQVFHIGSWHLVGTDSVEGQFACKRDVRDFTVKLRVKVV